MAALSNYSCDDFASKKNEFWNSMVTTRGNPPELILNWDQTGIKIIPSYSWTMDVKGAKRIEIVGLSIKVDNCWKGFFAFAINLQRQN